MSSNKPFPSSDLDVFKENSLILDHFVNSQDNEYPDRFNRKRPTITGIIKEAFNVRTDISNMNETLIGQSRWDAVPKNTSLSLGGDNGALNKQAQALFNRTVMLKVHAREALRRTYQEVGLVLVPGSFEDGGVLETITDVLLEEKTGKCYSWSGSFPKVVSKGSSPTSEVEFVERSDTGRNKVILTSQLTSGVPVVDPNLTSYWKIPVNGKITNIDITGTNTPAVMELYLFFIQGKSNAYDIALPSNVKRPKEITTTFLLTPNAETHIKLVTLDGGVTWYIDRFLNFSTSIFAEDLGENASFIDEGNSVLGWSSSNGTVVKTSDRIRLVKGGLNNFSNMRKSMTFTPDGKDFIIYAKIRATKLKVGDISTLFFSGADGKELSIWFGSTSGNISTGYADGAVSLGYRPSTAAGFTYTKIAEPNEVPYDTTDIEFALQYDSYFGQVSCWFKRNDGSWVLKGRIKFTWFLPSPMEINMNKHSEAPANSWIEFDYIMVCSPNIISIGDSICAGSTKFNPNMTLGLNDADNCWQNNCSIYKGIRNNLIVNKGVGGQSSAEILGRIADVTAQRPQLVFLQASNNDVVKNVTKEQRTINIQKTVDAVKAIGSKIILLNGLYATKSAPDNANGGAFLTFMKTWWDVESPKITGLFAKIDIMAAVVASDGYVEPSMAEADGVHPTKAGYQAIGRLVANR